MLGCSSAPAMAVTRPPILAGPILRATKASSTLASGATGWAARVGKRRFTKVRETREPTTNQIRAALRVMIPPANGDRKTQTHGRRGAQVLRPAVVRVARCSLINHAWRAMSLMNFRALARCRRLTHFRPPAFDEPAKVYYSWALPILELGQTARHPCPPRRPMATHATHQRLRSVNPPNAPCHEP